MNQLTGTIAGGNAQTAKKRGSRSVRRRVLIGPQAPAGALIADAASAAIATTQEACVPPAAAAVVLIMPEEGRSRDHGTEGQPGTDRHRQELASSHLGQKPTKPDHTLILSD